MKNLWRIVNPAPIARYIFPEAVWTTTSGKILITFDDAPDSRTTGKVLNLLDDYNWKAVFFCVGESSSKNPGLIREIASAGHRIGNHTYRHKNLIGLAKTERLEEIMKCNAVLSEITGGDIHLFRPPYGRISRKIIREAANYGLRTVMWSLLTYDYKNDLNMFKFAVRKISDGAIVTMHDHVKSEQILPEGLRYLADWMAYKQLKPGLPEECLK